jgi:hypothetical protein
MPSLIVNRERLLFQFFPKKDTEAEYVRNIVFAHEIRGDVG